MKKIAQKRLKELREEKGVTQSEVFSKTGINNKTLSGYENGVSEPDLDSITLLANYYGVSVGYLTGQTDNPVLPDTPNYILAAHRKDGVEELPEEAQKQLDDYIEYLRSKYRKK